MGRELTQEPIGSPLAAGSAGGDINDAWGSGRVVVFKADNSMMSPSDKKEGFSFLNDTSAGWGTCPPVGLDGVKQGAPKFASFSGCVGDQILVQDCSDSVLNVDATK